MNNFFFFKMGGERGRASPAAAAAVYFLFNGLFFIVKRMFGVCSSVAVGLFLGRGGEKEVGGCGL